MVTNSIHTNIAARAAQAHIAAASQRSSDAISRLSSGQQNVRTGDDTVAMSVGTALRSATVTIKAELNNAAQGASLLQTVDGALGEITQLLQRQKSLAQMAQSGALSNVDRGYLEQEFQALKSEVERITTSTRFNGQNVLAGGTQSTRTRLINTPFVAYNTQTNASALGGSLGRLQFMDTDGTVLSVGAERQGISPDLVGGLSNFRLTDIEHGVSAKLSVEIAGRTFTGMVVDGGNRVTVTDGTDRVRLGTGTIRLDHRAEFHFQRMVDAFNPVKILRRTDVNNVDFSGTRLEGGGNRWFFRLETFSAAPEVEIGNFRYLGSDGTNNSARLAVDVNGETFFAQNVHDNLRQNRQIRFANEGTRERFWIRLGNITPTESGSTEDNIRLNETLRTEVLDALNLAFARAGNGIDFGLGAQGGDGLGMDFEPIMSATIYASKEMQLTTQAQAVASSEQIDRALHFITKARADFGAMQRRVEIFSANAQSALQNQDAARAVFEDTNIAVESTAYAQSRVQASAGLAALAQANLMTRGFLELIA